MARPMGRKWGGKWFGLIGGTESLQWKPHLHGFYDWLPDGASFRILTFRSKWGKIPVFRKWRSKL